MGALFSQAEQEIGVLVYTGMFLADDPGLLALFRAKAGRGVRVRILLGDPDSAEVVADRGEHEGIDDRARSKIRNALVLYRPLRQVDGVEIRLHRTVLYNSIYRADDELLVNTHVYGLAGGAGPGLAPAQDRRGRRWSARISTASSGSGKRPLPVDGG